MADNQLDHLDRLEEALLGYAHEMHEYTLQLWTNSRRVLEEKKAAKAHKGGDVFEPERKLHEAKPRVIDFATTKDDVR